MIYSYNFKIDVDIFKSNYGISSIPVKMENVYNTNDGCVIILKNNLTNKQKEDLDNIVKKSREKNFIQVVEDFNLTGNNYQARSFIITVGNTGWNSSIISFPMPVVILNSKLIVRDADIGNQIEATVLNPKTTIGVVTETVSSGKNIVVGSSVISNTFSGAEITLVDTTQNPFLSQDLGAITSVDLTNSTILVENDIENTFPHTTTIVQQTIYSFKVLDILYPGIYEFGISKNGGSYFPPNVFIVIRYNNLNEVANGHKIQVILEYLY